VLVEVILVLVLGCVKGVERTDLSNDRIVPVRLGALHCLLEVILLPIVRIKQRRSILSADVCPLAVEGGWVVDQEEQVKNNLFWDDRFVKGDGNNLCMASLAG